MASIPRLGRGTGSGGTKERGGDTTSVTSDLSELVSLVLAYAKQETLDPIKLLGRYVLWGVIGAVLLSISGVLFTLGVVRLLQTELGVHVHGSLTWLPYIGGLIFALAFVGAAVSRIARAPR